MNRQPAATGEQGAILSCLARIRLRLWLVRVMERAALALTWAAGVAFFVTGGRLLMDRFGVLALVTTGVPLAIATWLWWQAGPLANPRAALARAGGITPGLLWACAILTAAVSLAAMVMFGWRLMPGLAVWVYPVSIAVIFVAAAIAMVRPAKAAAVAIFVDQQVGLKERVSTALEFFQTQPASELEAAFRRPVIVSAIKACNTVRDSKVGYGRIDSRVYPLAASVALVAAGICLIPPLRAQARLSHMPYLTVVERGNVMAEKLKELEQDPKLAEDPKAREALQKFNQIATEMKKGDVSPFEAQEKIASQLAEMKKQEDASQAATEMEKSFSKDFSELGKAGEDLRQATVNGNKSDSGAAEQKLKAESEISKAAGEMGDKLKGMSDQEKKDLADKLDKEAQKAGADSELKKDLTSAAQAAREGNSEQLSQNMAKAADRAAQESGQQGEQSGGQQASQEQLRQTMERIAEAESGGESQGEQQASNGGQSGQQNGGQQNQGSQSGGQQQSAGGQNGEGGQQQNGEGQNGSQQANGGGQKGGQGEGQKSASGQEGTGDMQRGPSSGLSTNLHQASGPGDRNYNGPIGGSETYVRIYDEKTIANRGKDDHVQGKINPISPPAGTVEVRGAADKDASSIRTYQDELPAQQKKALDDLQTQSIPPQYRDLIKAYYAGDESHGSAK